MRRLALIVLVAACSEKAAEVDAGRPYILRDDTVDDTGTPEVPGPDVAEADLGTPEEDAVETPNCPESQDPCAALVWDPEQAVCARQPANEGDTCGEATCVATAGKCTDGVCVPGPPPCQGSDPEGCWDQHCDDATVTCVKDPKPDGTDCAGVRWCLDGACSFVPTCAVAPDPTTQQYDADCGGVTGCQPRCDVGKCGCWRCDGPFCVEAGCDHSADNPTGAAHALVSLNSLPSEPAGGVVLEPQPILTASASVSVAEGGAVAMQVLFAYPGVPDEAQWGAGETKPLVTPKLVAMRLLVLRSATTYAPCAVDPVTAAEGALEVLSPSTGDGSTVEYDAVASEHGQTHLAVVRVLQDADGARYLQWVRLGGLDVSADALPGEPVTLDAQVLGALPATVAKPMGGLWSGVDWAAAVLATLDT